MFWLTTVAQRGIGVCHMVWLHTQLHVWNGIFSKSGKLSAESEMQTNLEVGRNLSFTDLTDGQQTLTLF